MSDIDTMEAGREMDVLIEEIVFGLEVMRGYGPPYYSTDINDAWSIVEWLVDHGYCPALLYDDEGHWCLSLEGTQTAGEKPDTVVSITDSWSDTAPLAICRAALKTTDLPNKT